MPASKSAIHDSDNATVDGKRKVANSRWRQDRISAADYAHRTISDLDAMRATAIYVTDKQLKKSARTYCLGRSEAEPYAIIRPPEFSHFPR